MYVIAMERLWDNEVWQYLLSLPTSPFSTPGPPTCTLWYPPDESCPTEYWNGDPEKQIYFFCLETSSIGYKADFMIKKKELQRF